MKNIIILFLFIGIFTIVHSIYEHKFEELKKEKKVEYRFVPRTYYEDQLSEPTVSTTFSSMFEAIKPKEQT